VKKVIVYVEGPSDRLALEELLEGLLQKLLEHGIAVNFIPTEGKKRLLNRTPLKALNILRNNPNALVVALPDLYPPNIVFEHRTVDELRKSLRKEIEHQAQLRNVTDARLFSRFYVFCLKYDLEALVLAAKKELASRLGQPTIERTWIVPVEDQDHDQPPKRVVEVLFAAYGERYEDTVDAPLILGAAHYPDIAEACPQCFQPFVAFLESLSTLEEN
jgi:hypothetical protein